MGEGNENGNLGHPKPEKIKLTRAEYEALRVEIYNLQHESCKLCYKWAELEGFYLHHIKHRWQGDDSVDNCVGLCAECHTKVHMGVLHL